MSEIPAGREPVGVLTRRPAYSEQDVKATLDSCRLTYVYEPEWTRLRHRVSHILSAGRLVAWFQGEAGGDGSAGGRVIICDPSNRWARENVNRFLRQVALEAPLPLVTTADLGRWHDGEAAVSPQSVSVSGAWRNQVVGALDRSGCVQLQEITEFDDRRLAELIREHCARTGVPALIAVPFSEPSEPLVCSPREAIRTMFPRQWMSSSSSGSRLPRITGCSVRRGDEAVLWEWRMISVSRPELPTQEHDDYGR